MLTPEDGRAWLDQFDFRQLRVFACRWKVPNWETKTEIELKDILTYILLFMKMSDDPVGDK